MNKEKCDCGNEAVWCYLPGFINGENPYFCDNCISSNDDKIGCTCNWKHSKSNDTLPTVEEGKDWLWVQHDGSDNSPKVTKEDGIWIKLDKLGRPLPCCEYTYEKNGFEIEE